MARIKFQTLADEVGRRPGVSQRLADLRSETLEALRLPGPQNREGWPHGAPDAPSDDVPEL